MSVVLFMFFFVEGYGDHRDLHVLTHSFPTRRSSDLANERGPGVPSLARRRHLVQQRLEHVVGTRSEEHTSELQSLMRISYAVFCLKKKKSQNHLILATSREYLTLCTPTKTSKLQTELFSTETHNTYRYTVIYI